MGLLPIVLHTDADVPRAFCHKRGVGKMKHLDVRHCWLHDELKRGNYTVKRAHPESLSTRIATISSSAGLPHDDGEEERRQRCQDDAETHACCQAYRISHEYSVCTAGGSRENEFRVTIPGSPHNADWTSIIFAALGILVSLLLVAFSVGKRYCGKNPEVKMRILEQTVENALWIKESSRSNDEMIRKRKPRNRSETAGQLGESKGAN